MQSLPPTPRDADDRVRRFRPFVRFTLPHLAWAAVMLVLLEMPGNDLPDLTLPFSNSDKVIHVVLFLVYTLLLTRMTLPGRRRAWHATRLVVFVAAFAASTEILQAFVPGRSADVRDFAADIVGVVIALLLRFFSTRRR